ncbi:hypothetical protein [Heyndrickxia coagulans]|uniref:hypothetical protein n=1 Tax=Heyndrickxia coagulans TaxID=1398 RepID=UPI001A9473BC|nr:hypothetical protein [Heyndrickxia coagulans]
MKEMGLLFSGYVKEQRVFRQPFRIKRACVKKPGAFNGIPSHRALLCEEAAHFSTAFSHRTRLNFCHIAFETEGNPRKRAAIVAGKIWLVHFIRCRFNKRSSK